MTIIRSNYNTGTVESVAIVTIHTGTAVAANVIGTSRILVTLIHVQCALVYV